jgi:hypothetical protein
MSNFTGFVQAGLQIGLDSILIKPKRGFYNIRSQDGKVTTIYPDIIAHATVEERHHDELEVTDHPVEQGAMINDHAFKRPAEVTLHLGWSNSPPSPGGLINPLIATAAANSPIVNAGANLYGLAKGVQGIQSAMSGAGMEQIKAIYQTLLQLQESRALFDLYTGKRKYVNMILKSLATETDFRSSNSLPITMTCKQVILVNTKTVALSKGTQANPQATASPADKGTQAAIPAKPDIKAQIRAGMVEQLRKQGSPVPASWGL